MTKKTPQFFRRENIRTIFVKFLKDRVIKLTPVFLDLAENTTNGEFETKTTFGFLQNGENVVLSQVCGYGLIDCLFTGLKEYYVRDFYSIANIKLVDLSVQPLMQKNKRILGSDAKVNLSFSVKIHGHGLSEFATCSRSLVNCSFQGVLDVFEFYLNCHRTFVKIKEVIADAKSRNRRDIVDRCLSDLSFLTEVNFYEEGKI
jgi:hypothetical protein